tara:strand:+ start:11229 stop:13673 length:2445 start_codon:yes stop_codon:yes gene_type:complete
MPSNFESLNSLDFLRGFKEGDQVDNDRFKETSDIVTDMAENRIEGVSEDEARSLGETIRDFFSSKNKMEEFREKNKAKIEADKKLIGKILNSTPAGQVRKFITKAIVKNYGPQFMDMTENFFKNILPIEDKSVPTQINWADSLSNQPYQNKAYNNDQYLEAGAGIDTNFSNIRAYLNMLPDNQQISTKDLLGELRRLGTEKYNETPFGKFYNPAELRESGFEYSLLQMLNKDPNAAMTTTEYINMFNKTDPKTSFKGFESRLSTQDNLLQNYRVGLENLEAQRGGTKEFNQFKFSLTSDLQNQFEKLNETLRGLPEDVDKGEFVGKMIKDAGKPIYEQIKANTKQIKRLKQGILPFNRAGRARDIAYLETQNQELQQLLSAVMDMGGNTGFQTATQAYLSAGQSSYSLGGGRNYTVKGITFQPRDVPGFSEKFKSSTHFAKNFGAMDTFHVRSADYKDISGLDTTIIQEVQSDQEEPRRKEKSVQDPSADLKINTLMKEIEDYTANSVLPEMEKRNIEPGILAEIETLYAEMMKEFRQNVQEAEGKIVNLPSFDKYINEFLARSELEGIITNDRRKEIYRFYKRIKPLYSLKNQLYNLEQKSGGDYSAIMPFVSNPQLYAEQAIWQTSLDSLKRGVNFLSWLPGEVQTQVQHGSSSVDFSNTEEVLAQYGKQAQGHFNFYGSAKNPENNTMYKAAENVIKKYDKMAEILGWENYESPKLYAQGNEFFNLQGDQFGTGNQYDQQPMLSNNQVRGKVPSLKTGYGFIDFTPMINSLTDKQKERLETINLNNFPSYKQGGQVDSPSLVSLEEVINGS